MNFNRRQSHDGIKSDIELLKDYCQYYSFKLVELQPWQIRIHNGKIVVDIYPTRKKFHNIITQERGIYTDVIELIDKTFLR